MENFNELTGDYHAIPPSSPFTCSKVPYTWACNSLLSYNVPDIYRPRPVSSGTTGGGPPNDFLSSPNATTLRPRQHNYPIIKFVRVLWYIHLFHNTQLVTSAIGSAIITVRTLFSLATLCLLVCIWMWLWVGGRELTVARRLCIWGGGRERLVGGGRGGDFGLGGGHRGRAGSAGGGRVGRAWLWSSGGVF